MASTSSGTIDASKVLSYLGLPEDYEPNPTQAPVDFLSHHFRVLPPNLLALFSLVVTPKQRTVIPAIRNRRLRYTESSPPELSFYHAKSTWPMLWQGGGIRGREEGKEEREWADKEFLGGAGGQIGKLGTLLAEYEEEREAERFRDLRRQEREAEEALPEEDEDTDDDDDEVTVPPEEEMSVEELQTLFLRRVKENFIYGLLESMDYDKVDWDDKWDPVTDRDEEERWFDDEEESEAVSWQMYGQVEPPVSSRRPVNDL